MRAFLVRAHQARIARHIGGENGGQPAFDALRSQSGAPEPHGPNRLSALARHSNGKGGGCHSFSVTRAMPFFSPAGSLRGFDTADPKEAKTLLDELT